MNDEGTRMAVFSNLLSHYHHQDNAMWRSVAWAIPVEFGTLIGFVNAKDKDEGLKSPTEAILAVCDICGDAFCKCLDWS